MEKLTRNTPPPYWIAPYVGNMIEHTVTIGYGSDAVIQLPYSYVVGHLAPPGRLQLHRILPIMHARSICSRFYWNKYGGGWKN